MDVSDYRSEDEGSWLRCRVLGFLSTSYFDDVMPHRPDPAQLIAMVVRGEAGVIGICDASVEGTRATIETVVVHPDAQRGGLGTLLLGALLDRLRARGVTRLDAWTREDPATLAWYAASQFSVTYRYLHVYADGPQEMADAVVPASGLDPRHGFFHVDRQDAEMEADLRRRFARVHGCHRMSRAV